MQTPFLLSEISDFSFGFTTDQGVRYVAYFLDYSYMFLDYPQLSDRIYTFNIDTHEGDADMAQGDDRIGATVVSIFKLFFEKVENVLVYVCDMSDERHEARKRKFDWWFWKYNDGTIIKEDGIAIVEGVEILNSLLIHRHNPHLMDIILAYKTLNARADEK